MGDRDAQYSSPPVGARVPQRRPTEETADKTDKGVRADETPIAALKREIASLEEAFGSRPSAEAQSILADLYSELRDLEELNSQVESSDFPSKAPQHKNASVEEEGSDEERGGRRRDAVQKKRVNRRKQSKAASRRRKPQDPVIDAINEDNEKLRRELQAMKAAAGDPVVGAMDELSQQVARLPGDRFERKHSDSHEKSTKAAAVTDSSDAELEAIRRQHAREMAKLK